MIEQILTNDNLEKAFLKVLSGIELKGRAGYYCGWDSIKSSDIEIKPTEIINSVKTELQNLTPLSPALLFLIPKKNKPQSFREIYVYNLKDRIKAQAIYQVLEPVFDNFFSSYLFSYRSSHSSYFAARSVARHYKKYWQRDSIFIADLSDYSKYINQNILKEKIKELNLGEEINKLLFLFIGNSIIKDQKIISPDLGLIQGVPIIALFNNLYLDAFDKKVGDSVDMYRRVGDDLIAFDQKIEKLKNVKELLYQEADELGLKINQEKTKLQTTAEKFNFLGYNYNQGKIGLTDSFQKSLNKKWQEQLFNRQSLKVSKKLNHLKKLDSDDKNNLKKQVFQLFLQKNLINDEEQIKNLSENFIHSLTRYFFKEYSPRNRRLLKKKIKNIKFASIYKKFINIRYGSISRKN